MSYTVPNLVLRNLDDVFGEIDPQRRPATIDEMFHEDAETRHSRRRVVGACENALSCLADARC
jgi:hypothetical protein